MILYLENCFLKKKKKTMKMMKKMILYFSYKNSKKTTESVISNVGVTDFEVWQFNKNHGHLKLVKMSILKKHKSKYLEKSYLLSK